jgi:hypothetical protein
MSLGDMGPAFTIPSTHIEDENTVAHSAIPHPLLRKEWGNEGCGSNDFVARSYSRMPSNISCVIAAGCGVAAEISV